MSSVILLHNGTIHPMVRASSSASALLIRNGRVAALGERSELRSALGADGVEIDLRGCTVLPGLVDTHPHLLHFEAESDGLVDLADAVDHEDIVRRVAAKARTTPPGEWIVTTPVGEPFYFLRRSYLDLAERVLPNRGSLDRATSDHPVFIQAWAPTEPNVCAFNSEGLKRIGLDESSPERIDDVWIERDHFGRLSGLLRGAVNEIYSASPFWLGILDQLPRRTPNLIETTKRAVAKANARGVTTIYEPHEMTAEHVTTYRTLRDRSELDVRVELALEIDHRHAAEDPLGTLTRMRERLAEIAALRDASDEYVRVTGATLSFGGLLTCEPHCNPYGRMTKGVRDFDPQVTRGFVDGCLQHGLRGNFLSADFVHHDHMLDVLEEPDLAAKVRESGWVVQHAVLTSPVHARRFAALGLAVTTSAGFGWAFGAAYEARIGRHAWRDLVPLKRLLREGLIVGAGSDWGPPNPFEQIALAQTGEIAGTELRNATADHAVNREEAVAMWTSEAGRLLRWPGVGTLAAGAPADVIVLDRDPLACSVEELVGTKVELTLVGGRAVHETGAIKAT